MPYVPKHEGEWQPLINLGYGEASWMSNQMILPSLCNDGTFTEVPSIIVYVSRKNLQGGIQIKTWVTVGIQQPDEETSNMVMGWIKEEEPRQMICYPCNGKGRHLEKLDDDDPGAWFECSCCNGTGINQHGTSEAVKAS